MISAKEYWEKEMTCFYTYISGFVKRDHSAVYDNNDTNNY